MAKRETKSSSTASTNRNTPPPTGAEPTNNKPGRTSNQGRKLGSGGDAEDVGKSIKMGGGSKSSSSRKSSSSSTGRGKGSKGNGRSGGRDSGASEKG